MMSSTQKNRLNSPYTNIRLTFFLQATTGHAGPVPRFPVHRVYLHKGCKRPVRRLSDGPGTGGPKAARVGGRLLTVAPVTELVGQRRAGRVPAEFGAGLGRVGALVEQQDVGEIAAEACPGFVVGTGDRSWRPDRGSGGLREFGDRLVRPVADDVVAAGRVVFQGAPEGVGQVRDVYCRPVLSPGAEHDEVSGLVAGGAEDDPGDPAAAVAISGA